MAFFDYELFFAKATHTQQSQTTKNQPSKYLK